MFIWLKEVIFNVSENFLLPPKIVGWWWGGLKDLKCLESYLFFKVLNKIKMR